MDKYFHHFDFFPEKKNVDGTKSQFHLEDSNFLLLSWRPRRIESDFARIICSSSNRQWAAVINHVLPIYGCLNYLFMKWFFPDIFLSPKHKPQKSFYLLVLESLESFGIIAWIWIHQVNTINRKLGISFWIGSSCTTNQSAAALCVDVILVLFIVPDQGCNPRVNIFLSTKNLKITKER